MASYRIISSDNHVFEPPDLWTNRVEAKYKERAPHIVSLDDGDYWFCDGIKGIGLGPGAQVGLRFEEPEKQSYGDRLENVRPGGYIPEEHVKDLDTDGVDVSILYPSAGLLLYLVPDSDLLTSMCSVYNDWLSEFCNTFPSRLMGIAMLNADDVPGSIKELERCANKGLIGAMITVAPLPGHEYNSQEYETLWAAAQDQNIPLGFHVSTNRPGPGAALVDTDAMDPSFMCNQDYWVRSSLARMIFSGVFERYPKLQMGSIEFELSWVPHFLDRLDYTYTQRAPQFTPYKYSEDMLPTDYFHRNVFLSFQEDALGVRDREIIGVENILWGSDYPHQESTFPRSQEILEEILEDCSEEEKTLIVGGNAARVFHL